MSRIHNLGMPQDMKQREPLARVDDEIRRGKVESARNIIYNKRFAVDSPAVEILLKEQSLVPTSVSLKNRYDFVQRLITSVERIFTKA